MQKNIYLCFKTTQYIKQNLKRKRLTIGVYLMRRTQKNMKYVHCLYLYVHLICL
jgi:hypothetical protein